MVKGIAQLGERYNGIVEVVGSIPIGSTTIRFSNATDVTAQARDKTALQMQLYRKPVTQYTSRTPECCTTSSGVPSISTAPSWIYGRSIYPASHAHYGR